MQTKIYNSYRITHKNGNVEEVIAPSLVDALEHMEISEEYSPVLQTYMTAEGVRTLVSDFPAEVPFTSVVAEGAGGSIATPLSGTIHVGDSLTFKAIPARNYTFVNWKMNGVVVSEEAEFIYTMPELHGEASAVFTATFKLADVAWTATVSPAEATGAGCLGFPLSGSTPANGELQLLAVEGEGYTFSHWERNGETLTTNKLATVTVTPLAEGEESCTYVAVFTQD